MAQSLHLDTGVQEFEVNGRAIFRFNPADPNLYANILEFEKTLTGFQERYQALKLKMYHEAYDQAKAAKEAGGEEGEAEVDIDADDQGFPESTPEIIRSMKEMDQEIKEQLGAIFGQENDFDAIFDHKSAMAITESGASILENFLEMITPLVTEGASGRSARMQQVQEARAKALANRAGRSFAVKRGGKKKKKGKNGKRR